MRVSHKVCREEAQPPRPTPTQTTKETTMSDNFSKEEKRYARMYVNLREFLEARGFTGKALEHRFNLCLGADPVTKHPTYHTIASPSDKIHQGTLGRSNLFYEDEDNIEGSVHIIPDEKSTLDIQTEYIHNVHGLWGGLPDGAELINPFRHDGYSKQYEENIYLVLHGFPRWFHRYNDDKKRTFQSRNASLSIGKPVYFTFNSRLVEYPGNKYEVRLNILKLLPSGCKIWRGN